MSTSTLPTERTITSHNGAQVVAHDTGTVTAAPDHRTDRRRLTAHPAPPAAVTLDELPAALVTHDCGPLCRGDVHGVAVTVPTRTPWLTVDAAAALGGVRTGIIRPARPCERRTIPAPGWRTDVLVWADR